MNAANKKNSFDLIVIGAGINGAGIARDAAGRGLSVLVVEQDDIAAATSQWSTKLIHGGLRYLEYYEFRLVRESLSEREVVLHQAPHLVQPLQFVLPHEPHLRPAWMLRIGLFMYDHFSRRVTLPGSFGVDLAKTKWGAGLRHDFRKGFVYADARVDDARLVVANEMSARALGADVRVRTRFAGARREAGPDGQRWRATLVPRDGGPVEEVTAKAIVNVAGPWVKVVRDTVSATPSRENVRHVKGSHIVVPRVHAEDHAYILQNADKRIVFVIPFADKYSLIGTTDVPVSEFEHPEISGTEVEYLLKLANTYLEKPLSKADVVWTFSGIRPLYDDGQSDPSAITRDYVLKQDGAETGAPLLSVYGGKITTYRRLAEHVLEQLRPTLPTMGPAWTLEKTLPGGDLPAGGIAGWVTEMQRRYAGLPAELVRGVARRHGSLAPAVLGDAKGVADLGEDFGNGLTAREVAYFVREEWARSADDVLWRRSKCGLGMTEAQTARVAACVAETVATLA
jgi:glycerol-3-phosphate dehydrogenase